MLNLPDNHIAFKVSGDIKRICKPLKDYFGIIDFLYEKVYKDNSRIKLTNQPEWLHHYYMRGFHLLGDCEENINHYKSGYKLASTMESQEIFKYCRDYFNIDYSIVIIDKFEDYCDFFWFASTRENREIVDFYLNNIDLLRRFILYFKEKSFDIVKKVDKQRIIMPDKVIVTSNSVEGGNKRRDDFIDATQIKKYTLSGKYQHITLSKKEFECAIRLLEGKTADEIGLEMFRSRRTIESHIAAMKVKLNCTSKSTLIKILLGSGFGIYANKNVTLI